MPQSILLDGWRLWPLRLVFLVVLGIVAGVLIFLVEVIHWVDGPVAPGFLATAGGLLVVEGMGIGAVLGVGCYPGDRAAGRIPYLTLLGVRPAKHVAASLLRNTAELGLTVTILCASASGLAWLFLPPQLTYPSRVAFPTLANEPLLADIVAAVWCLVAALVIAALAHLLSVAGLGRLLAGGLASVSAIVVGLAFDQVGFPQVLNLFEPKLWSYDNPVPSLGPVSGLLFLLLAFILVGLVSMGLARILPEHALMDG